jgi:hypothetical protein
MYTYDRCCTVDNAHGAGKARPNCPCGRRLRHLSAYSVLTEEKIAAIPLLAAMRAGS